MNAEKIILLATEAIVLAILTGSLYWIIGKFMITKKVLPAILMILEIIALSSLAIGTYFGTWLLAGALAYCVGYFFITGAIAIAIADILYICTVKFWSSRNIHIKIAVGLLLFACSAAIATCYIAISMFVMPS
jgi:hypothetical protein